MLDQDINENREQQALARRKLIVRVAVAGGLIVALLAALLIFEQQKKEAEPEQPANIVARSPDIGVALSNSVSSLSEDVQTAIKNAPDMAQATLAGIPASVLEAAPVPPPVPVAPVVPEGSKDPSVKPILGVPMPAVERVAPRTGKPVSGDRLLVEPSKPVAVLAPVPAPAPQAAAAPVLVTTPAASTANGNFVVQLGVFNNLANAEDLRSKLKQAGIPSQLETRVQVGPFAKKEDALKAQEKLSTLGLGHGMLVPAKKP